MLDDSQLNVQIGALIEDFDFETITKIVRPATVARSWIRYQQSTDLERSKSVYWWSYWLMKEIPDRSDGSLFMKTLKILVDIAPDNQLADLAAAHFEDMLVGESEEIISWFERRALESPRFRLAMRSMWLTSMSPQVAERIEVARQEPYGAGRSGTPDI